MPQIELDGQVFQIVQRRATEAGYSSIDQFVCDVLLDNLTADLQGDFDHLFTPERIAQLRRIAGQIEAGGLTYTMDQVKDHFQEKRKRWGADHRT